MFHSQFSGGDRHWFSVPYKGLVRTLVESSIVFFEGECRGPGMFINDETGEERHPLYDIGNVEQRPNIRPHPLRLAK